MGSDFTHEEILKMNKIVRQWAYSAKIMMKGRAKGKVSSELRVVNKYSFGLIEATGFKFPRYGIFVEQGVFGGLTKKEAGSRGKLNPKPWFNPVIEKKVPQLGANLAKATGELIINAVRLKI